MQLWHSLLELLKYIAALGGGPSAPSRQASDYLPTYEKLRQQVLHLTVNRAPFINEMLDPAIPDSVGSHWNDAQAAGLINRLNNARGKHEEMTTSSIQPIPNVGDPIGVSNKVGRFDDRLLIDGGGGITTNTVIGRDLIMGTPGAPTVADVTSSKKKAAGAVMSLRLLDDVLLRALTARDAADRTGATWPEVMALFRAEGQMPIPCSKASLGKKIPSAWALPSDDPARPDKNHLKGPERFGWDVDMSHAVILFEATGYSGLPVNVRIAHALAYWFMLIAGVDQFSTIAKGISSGFEPWSKASWSAIGHPDAGQALSRWARFANTIKFEDVTAHGSTATVVTPQDPLHLVSGILQEAIVLQKAMRRVESLLEYDDDDIGVFSLPSGHPLRGTLLTPGMSYLQYNAGNGDKLIDDSDGYLKKDADGKMLLNTDGTPQIFSDGDFSVNGSMRAIIASAIIYASESTSLEYLQIKAAINNDTDLALWVANRGHAIRANQGPWIAALMIAEWWHIAQWLRMADNLQLISHFIETAPGRNDAWPSTSWSEHRGNLSRYRLLLDYYQRL